MEKPSSLSYSQAPVKNWNYYVYVLRQKSEAFVMFVGLFHETDGYWSWKWR